MGHAVAGPWPTAVLLNEGGISRPSATRYIGMSREQAQEIFRAAEEKARIHRPRGRLRKTPSRACANMRHGYRSRSAGAEAFEALYYIVGRDPAEHRATTRAENGDAVFASRQASTQSRELIARSDRTFVRHRELFRWLLKDDPPRW
jgi:hypothetical protein